MTTAMPTTAPASPTAKVIFVIQGDLEVAALNVTEQRQWTETKAAFIVVCPSFAHILYTLMNPSQSEHLAYFTRDPRIPTAAVNGVTLFINPDFFFQLPMKQRIAVLAHEILHCVFDHCGQGRTYTRIGKIGLPSGRTVDFNGELANIAQDYVINDIIHESYCTGSNKVAELGADWLWDKDKGTHEEQWPTVYERLLKQSKPQGGKRFDLHLHPGEGDPQEKREEQRNEAEWRTQIAAAITAGAAQGEMPAALKRALESLLEPKVSWGEYIQGWLARKLGSNESDWRRADRRLIVQDMVGLSPFPVYAPSRRGNGCETVVIGVDTSGSIGKKQLQEFMAEVGGVLTDVKPRRLIIIWCDAAVHQIDEVEDASDLYAIIEKGPGGGGGTSFKPVFEKIEELGLEDVEALLYLTDGMGSFPRHRPEYPVLWGSILNPPNKFPFGEVIMIPRIKDA